MRRIINKLLWYLPKSKQEKLESLFNNVYKLKLKREKKIRSIQDLEIINNYSSYTKRLVVFLLPSADLYGNEIKTGGIISIESIFSVSRNILKSNETDCILVTEIDANLFTKFTFIESEHLVYRFEQISTYFKNIDFLTIHVPEISITKLLRDIDLSIFKKTIKNKFVHINILNQNILFMPPVATINTLKDKFDLLTQTTAHVKYSNDEVHIKYGIPLHHLSTHVDQKKYYYKRYEDKEDLIIFSNDNQIWNNKIIEKLTSFNKRYTFKTIQNITFEEYKQLISKAKFCFTFGEGLDGYFVEPILSGSVAFAIYNEDFFTSAYKDLFTTSNSFIELLEEVVDKVNKLEEASFYNDYSSTVQKIINKQYSFDKYVENIRKFYDGDYLFK